MSCEWAKHVITSPIAINNKDLKSAWVKRWKKAKWIKPLNKLNPIKPKWLRVERAISFLRSRSKTEFKPA